LTLTVKDSITPSARVPFTLQEDVTFQQGAFR